MSGLGQRRRTRFNANRLIPNAVTLLAVCAGMTAIRMALQDRWEIAVGAVVVAMILDAMDGRIARMMRATSDFGAHLDSLSDVINFGVAPALIVYLWTTHDIRGLGWALSLVFAICCALRLARFNTDLEKENPPPWANTFFTGVPAPAGAGLVLLPMAMSFTFGDEVFRAAWLNAAVVLIVAGLMVSRIPTFSSKRLKIKRQHAWLVLLGFGILGAFLVSTPWITLSVVGLLYAASIPFSVLAFRRVWRTPGPGSDNGNDQA
jgi:CDP-diacylglycerol--serine O-phosphatidyltransferase